MASWILGYALTGILAGLLAGLMGVGGGLVIVPALLFLLGLQGFDPGHLAHVAVGSSLAAIVPISIASLWSHHRRGAVEWPTVLWFSPGLMLGAWSGAWLAAQMSTAWLKGLFGAFLLLVAVQMLSGFRPPSSRRGERVALFGPAGWLIGLVSGLVGIGGGTMTVPLLAWLGKPLPQAIATSAACGLPIALAGSLGFMFTGDTVSDFIHWKAAAVMALFAVFTAPVGAHWAHHLPVSGLRKMFAFILLLVSLRLLFAIP